MSETLLSFESWSAQSIAHFEWFAEHQLPRTGMDPKKLIGAMRYAVLNGGKRVRALLVYAAGMACGAKLPTLDTAALAVECIHAYSLVHDDMPAMDNDTLRRGKPTVHVAYGEALAMLAGDALQTEAFSLLSRAEEAPEKVVLMMKSLSFASGIRGMAGGQALDLAMVGQKPEEFELFRMQTMKTGALIVGSILMGAQAGSWTQLSEATQGAFARYGHSLGLLFQVVDDILDCTQNTETLGKTAGKDAKDDKPTWVSFKGLDGAKDYAQSLYDEALAALEDLKKDALINQDGVFYMQAIVDLVKKRTH